MATKGTLHQKRGDIGLIDWMLADAVNKFAGVGGNSSFCVVVNALEHYREALVNDVATEEKREQRSRNIYDERSL